MGIRWFILVVVTLSAVLACCPPYLDAPPQARLPEQTPPATPPKQTPQAAVVHIIRYDIMSREILSVTEEATDFTTDTPAEAIYGIPAPLQDKTIKRIDAIQILSDIASPHCTCYRNLCVGSNCR